MPSKILEAPPSKILEQRDAQDLADLTRLTGLTERARLDAPDGADASGTLQGPGTQLEPFLIL